MNGKLIEIGIKTYGLQKYNFFECEDCKTIYPEMCGKIICNGHIIDQCPWCRPDSRPWTNGRGQ